uniref:Uncharacterized protein n=1 Tax=Panagrolaimus sp. JU765 TaxID=591449 RepID=A0AC34QZ75_9BILA
MFYWIIGCISLIFWPDSVKDSVFDDFRNTNHGLLGISIFIMVIIVLYQFYTFIIVKEAFLFMKNDKKLKKIRRGSSDSERTPLLV